MIILSVLAFFVSTFIALISLMKVRRVESALSRAEGITNVLSTSLKLSDEMLKRLYVETLTTSEGLRRVLMVLDISKINYSQAIQRTILRIFKSEKLLTPREVSVEFMSNLSIEYNDAKAVLRERITASDDVSDKDKLLNVINELDTITNLLGTISVESSDEYLDQIFKEVVIGVNKIRSV